MAPFYIEVTPDDRIFFDVRVQNAQLTGLRIKTQSYEPTDRVITDIRGFDPFNVGEWLTIVKYDNWKGPAVRDAMRPTPVAFSPLGMHVKEQWGFLDVYALLDKALQDIRDNWQKDYFNYGELTPPSEQRIEHMKRDLPFVMELAHYIVHDRTILEQLQPEQAIMPLPHPGLDDWVIEQNTFAMNRTEKVALRGRLSIEALGTHQIITHRPRVEGEDIISLKP